MKNRPPMWYTLQAVFSWMLEEILLAAVVLWLLPRFFNVDIPWWGLAILMAGLAAYSGIMYRVGRHTFFIKPRVAPDDIIGSEGTVTRPLAPEGNVKVQGILWKAVSQEAKLGVGDKIEVIGMEGLKLIVKSRSNGSEQRP
jgi:membrane protein implicated in regulation of membrane protease activity